MNPQTPWIGGRVGLKGSGAQVELRGAGPGNTPARELLLPEAATGAALVHERLFLAGASGRLWIVDPAPPRIVPLPPPALGDLHLAEMGGYLLVAESGADIGYYHGVEGGESWSEGSSRSRVHFRAPPAGRYRLLFQGTGGSGSSGPARGENLEVSMYRVGALGRYFLFAGGFALLFPILGWLGRLMFEGSRWAPVVGGDDDDD